MDRADSSASLSFLSEHRAELQDYPALKQYAQAGDPFLAINNELYRLYLMVNLNYYHFVSELYKNENMAGFLQYYEAQYHSRKSLSDELGWYIRQLELDLKAARYSVYEGAIYRKFYQNGEAFESILLQKCQEINRMLDAPRIALNYPNSVEEGEADLFYALRGICDRHKSILIDMDSTLLEIADLKYRVTRFTSDYATRCAELMRRCASAEQRATNSEVHSGELEAENRALRARMEALEYYLNYY